MMDLNFDFLRQLVHARSGQVLEPDQAPRLESRLAEAAETWGYSSPSALMAILQENPQGPEAWRLTDLLMPKETYFFRDPQVFDGLEKAILPDLIAQHRHDRRLSLWCAAASSGQEPYSLALLIAEKFPELRNWDLRLVATDLSGPMLKRAEEGLYSQMEVNRGLPASYLVRYFQEETGGWRLQDSIRARVEFKRLNLIEPWAWGHAFDLILARNVLIYFDDETKKEFYRKCASALEPRGVLVLGSSETPLFLAPEFGPLTDSPAVGYRLGQSAPQGRGAA